MQMLCRVVVCIFRSINVSSISFLHIVFLLNYIYNLILFGQTIGHPEIISGVNTHTDLLAVPPAELSIDHVWFVLVNHVLYYSDQYEKRFRKNTTIANKVDFHFPFCSIML